MRWSRLPSFSNILLLIALFTFNTGAHADELVPVLGPLAEHVTVGVSGAWTADANGDAFHLRTSDSGSIRFYQVPWAGERSTGRSVGVRVRSEP